MRTTIIALLSCCLLFVVVFGVVEWRSYQQHQFASAELGRFGGTHTRQSAARLRDEGIPPTFLELKMIANPITEVNLSIYAWPREEGWGRAGQGAFPLVTDYDLGFIEGLNHLQRLTLRGMPITDAAIKQLSRLKNLKRLDVRDTEISAEGLSRLKVALPACEVEGGPA